MAACIMLSRVAGSNCMKLAIRRSSLAHFNVRSASFQKRSQICGVSAYMRIPALIRNNTSVSAQSTAPIVEQKWRQQTSSVSNQEVRDSVITLLTALDTQVQRTGRVEQKQVEQILNLILKAGTVSSQEAVMLLNCSGSLLVKLLPAERIALCDRICEVLHKLGVVFNLQMYNALLRIKLQNGQAFSPIDMLTEIEVTKQLEPNRVTYQLLLSQFCEEGNIEGASKVLEHMKSQNIELGEQVMNALVKGHIVKGDMPGAMEVITNMGKAGLEPSGNTYSTLMCGWAEKGDMSAIQKLLDEIRTSSVFISPSSICSVILALANNGQDQHIPQIIDFLHSHFRAGKYSHDTLNCVYRLVANGHDDAAYLLYSSMEVSTSLAEDRDTGKLCQNFLRCMIERTRPLDKVLEFYQQFKSQNLASDDTMEFLAFLGFRSQHTAYGLDLVNRLKTQGFVTKEHYYWPLLNACARNNDVEGVFNVISSIAPPGEANLSTIYRWGIRVLVNNGHNMDTLLEKFKEVGWNGLQLQLIRTAMLVTKGDFSEAAKLIDCGIKHSLSLMYPEIVTGLVNSNKDIDGLVAFMESCKRQQPNEKKLIDFFSFTLCHCCEHKHLKLEVIEKLIDIWHERGWKVFGRFRPILTRDLHARKASDQLFEKLSLLFTDDITRVRKPEEYSVETLKKASYTDLLAMAEKAKADGRSTTKLEKWMLHRSCYDGQIEQSDALKATLESKGFVFQEESLRLLGVLAARNKGNLEEALFYKNELESRHPSFDRYAILVLYIAKLQLIAGTFDDAIKTLKDFAFRQGNMSESKLAEGYMMARVISTVIQESCKFNDAPRTIELLDVLFDNGFVKPGTFDLLNHLLIGYVNKSDSAGVVAALEYCVNKFGKAPVFSVVFKHLIVKEDARLLQKAVDLMTTLEGELYTLLHLSACLVECGKLKQARKVLETPGLQALTKPLNDICFRFIRSDKENELKQFVDITKNLPGIQREQMLLQLFKYHARKRDVPKMMEDIALFEDERIPANSRAYVYIVKVLQGMGLAVPFEISKDVQLRLEQLSVIEKDQLKPQQSSNDMDDQLKLHQSSTTPKPKLFAVQSLNETNKPERFLEAKQKYSATEFSDLIFRNVQILLKQNKIDALKRLMNQLSESGDVDNLLHIKKMLPPSYDSQLHRCLLVAHIHRNSVDQFLDSLDGTDVNIKNYLSLGTLRTLAEKSPDQFARLEKLAIESAKSNNDITSVGYLYSYYVLDDHWGKVTQLLQTFDHVRHNIPLRFVCRAAKKLKQENLLKKLIELHENDGKSSLIQPCNTLLIVKCQQENWSEAIECYNSILSKGLAFDDIWVQSLQLLQSLAKANQQQVPWQAEQLEKKILDNEEAKRKRHAISSSSSDSDSSSDSSDSDREGPPKK